MSALPRIRWEDHCWPVHTLEVNHCIVGDVQRSDGKWIGQVTSRSISEPVSLAADTQEGAERALLERLLEHHESMVKALQLAIGEDPT
jgi:hypothetical protein